MSAFKKALSIYWTSTKKYPRQVALSSLMVVGNTLQSVVTPLIIAAIVNNLISHHQADQLFFRLIGLLAGNLLLSTILEAIGRRNLEIFEELAATDIDGRIIDHLLHLSYHFHTNSFAGSLVSQVNSFRGAYWTIYENIIFNILPFLTATTGAVIVLGRHSIWLAIIFLGLTIVFGLITIFLARRRNKFRVIAAALGSKHTGRLADAIGNVMTIKLFANEQQETKDFIKSSTTWMDAVRIATFKAIRNARVIRLLGSGLQMLIFVMIAFNANQLSISTGFMLIIFAYTNRLTDNLYNLSDTVRAIERAAADAQEMAEILMLEPEITDQPDAKPLEVTSGGIHLANVSYIYPKSGQPLFENLSLDILPHQTVGLVGPSGGGKTSFTKLLLRLFDPSGGEVLIDGQSLHAVTEVSVRRAIAYVPQDPALFHRSIAANIGYGKPGASRQQIIAAAKQAHAHQFITELNDGYDTLVGERGVKLSGGQRQRIAIARAILKDAPILVFDEATSALDSESERLIQQALFNLMKGRTAIIIAHRLSTIKHLDRIIVMENGRITEDGTHQQLSSQPGTYARLWSHQSGQVSAEPVD